MVIFEREGFELESPPNTHTQREGGEREREREREREAICKYIYKHACVNSLCITIGWVQTSLASCLVSSFSSMVSVGFGKKNQTNLLRFKQVLDKLLQRDLV